ncbi:MAG TPA: helicase C-terminal domain-containing protein [Verrucomicrobiae bacterium]|jgi:ATP-dependent DNA helicase DinG|nr:helicase C-terminal domain-containing protein [Verrucomicrobiae bacterium]
MISLIEQAAGAEKSLAAEVERIFSASGLLSKARNFEYRPEQQAMAVAVARALEKGDHLVVEAGTGVGKSLAYLIPSILFAVRHSKKAVISTHTINLQEQLIEKDLPMLAQILPVKFEFTMLKGRHNYLCTRRLTKAMGQASQLFTSTEAQELERIFEWSQKTEDGSLSDFEVEPDLRVWGQVCSERGLCSPKVCGDHSEFVKLGGKPCFFQRARSRILSADVLVINHTLFFLQMGAAEEENSGGILFKNDFVVFDEAHTVERVAARHAGLSVSSAQLRYALHRLWNPATKKGLLTVLGRGKEGLVTDALKQAEIFYGALEGACEEIAEAREGQKARSWSEVRVRRSDVVDDNITGPLQRVREEVTALIKTVDDRDTTGELTECNRRLAELREQIAVFLGQGAREHVYWVERTGKAQRNFALNAAPINVAEFLRQRLFSASTSVVMTSATLAVKAAAAKASDEPAPEPVERSSRFEEEEDAPTPAPAERAHGLMYFARQVGAEKAELLQAGSPFDYERQMKLYVAAKMPEPRDPRHVAALIGWIEHFVTMTHGKAFVLFTNFKLMLEVAERMEPFFDRLGVACFVQGTGTPRSLMLEKFKNDIDSVLFGTDSFWQGVDVPGDALSNVIITRLPFAVPDHPLIEAKLESIEARGGNPFMEFSLPEAILKFRQGVGRLIRVKSDRGIVAVLDNRVLTKKYGQAFLAAVPKCPVEIV